MNVRCIITPHFDSSFSITPRWIPSISRNAILHQKHRRRCFTAFRCQFGLESIFTALNSIPPLDLLLPIFGAASAASAFYLRRSLRSPDDSAGFGDWILYTSPTPFNRCVLLRCPSVLFEDGGELMDGVNDLLVRKDRHYVNLSRGRIPLRDDGVNGFENELKFQRVCVSTDDGGVICLDWPDYLNLEREHGLDTTVLIIPGTPEGSMDRTVKLFVLDVLKHGYFPIVMNPRGCAGSALTTPRLFTPADSDDVSTAVQFVSEVRPWTTLMGIGWGYGANMMTKYLAETGERTPITAAVCIDTPFDLDECTKSPSYLVALNEKLTSGLSEILRANKELFQGKTKGFDVAKALSATSIRDFDKAVSMISYGFDSLENFYRESCTLQLIGNLKIPTLFIQSDDGTVPLFSIPRSSISDNPFTSLLLCSCSHLAVKRGDLSALLWSHQLAIEWLSAVEHAFLKSHHPLLNDVDITIKPSNGLAFSNVEEREKSVSARKKTRRRYYPSYLLSRNYHKNADSYSSNAVEGVLVYPQGTEANGNGSTFSDNAIGYSKSGSRIYKMLKDNEHGTDGSKNENYGTDKDILTEDVRIEDKPDSISSAGSEVTHTANVIMNMLDVTMPGVLDDEHKKKVLSAMEKGETFLKALKGAVPEDVRGRITTSVAEIMQSQTLNLNFEAVKRIGWIPNTTSELKLKIQEKIVGTSSKELGSDVAPIEQREVKSNGVGSEGHDIPQEMDGQSSGSTDVDSEMEDKTVQSNKSDQVGGETNEDTGGHYEVTEKSDSFHNIRDQSEVLADDVSTADENEPIDSLLDLNISNSIDSEESFSAGSSMHQVQEKEKGSQNNDVSSTQDASQTMQASSKSEEPSPQLSSSESHSVSVTQALDALTGFDDSTQMAVNSVFGVIENMIDQLEKNNQDVEKSNQDVEHQGSLNGFDDVLPKNEEISSKFNCSNNGPGTLPDLSKPATQQKYVFNEDGIESYEDIGDKSGYNNLKNSLATSSGKNSKQFVQVDIASSPLSSEKMSNHQGTMDLNLDAVRRYWLSPCATYHRYFTQLPNPSSLDLETATDLFLDPEEGQWKMIDHSSNSAIKTNQNGMVQNVNFASELRCVENAVEPSYVIPDGEHSKCGTEVLLEGNDKNDNEQDGLMKRKLFFLIKNTLLDDLKVEVGRKKRTSDLKKFDSLLAYDLENFTNKVSQAVVSCSELNLFDENVDSKSVRFRTIEGQQTVEIILSSLQDAIHLREVLPSGVIVGTSLASLRTYFQIVALHGVANKVIKSTVNMQQKSNGHEHDIEVKHSIADKVEKEEDEHHLDSNKSVGSGHEVIDRVGSVNDGIMVGAVTAALGASALLVNHQKKMVKSYDTKEIHYDLSNKSYLTDDEYMQEKNQNSLVSSLAEKAMSVAAPVMPTKDDGGVDHERLVAILAELGQKGGILRSVGKIALLWGGLRGAMSLTDRLISFLHISERPLFQRVLGFVCMVLVLWSPVAIPLLPTLVQSWTTHTPNRIVEFAGIVGLYISSMVLVILWGKRIRGYDNPIKQYGMDLTSVPMVFDFLKGLVGGIMIVSFIHSVNAVLGYVSFSWTRVLPSSPSRSIFLLKTYGGILLLTLEGIASATGISIIEELLFRSWLAEEIAVELGYYRAIMISGLMFALIQRSLTSVPGFLLLSIFLFGIKQRTRDKLAAPIGIRTGLLAANFVIQKGNLLSYRADTPFWLASTHPWHPLDGAVGISLCAILAIFFFPRPPYRPIRQ